MHCNATLCTFRSEKHHFALTYCIIALFFSIRGRFYRGIYHYFIKNIINNI